MVSQLIAARTIDLGGSFKAFYFDSRPPRLEAAVIFDISHMSQKLLFHMMEISWKHGFGCAAPQFGTPEDDEQLVFSIGTSLPSTRSVRKYSARLQRCLKEVREFAENFSRQLDFSKLDISMFEGLSYSDFDPQFMAALRDQQYGGSWQDFQKDMAQRGRFEEADVVERCALFEELNDKDMGLIGAKLGYELAMLEGVGGSEDAN
jgi:hypothetical protein